ncbi:hypothetical protein BgiMline_025837, partial [Biomphalaria glabrata]
HTHTPSVIFTECKVIILKIISTGSSPRCGGASSTLRRSNGSHLNQGNLALHQPPPYPAMLGNFLAM